MALARTREAMHNSWDKNDPKDAQVILHMLKTGLSQTWHDPLVSSTNDAQELSKTHHQVTLARTRGGTAYAITTFPCTSLRSSTSSVPTTAIG
jgi:hypothetical protein